MPLYQIDLPELRDSNGVLYGPTGEYRRPKPSEFYLGGDGGVMTASPSYDGLYLESIILRPTWQWPAYLSGWGIAQDETGGVFLYEKPAFLRNGEWDCRGALVNVKSLAWITGFTPPIITDWRVPVLNPNYKPA